MKSPVSSTVQAQTAATVRAVVTPKSSRVAVVSFNTWLGLSGLEPKWLQPLSLSLFFLQA